ncbi:MAG: acyltransferase [Halioglobus sp.]
MLGTYRYVLALLVTLSHLWTSLAGWSGVVAVFGFFLISGYLMTSILHHSYGFDMAGLRRYAVNRFLRIYPSYWTVLLLSLLVVYAIPKDAFLTNFKLSMPRELVAHWLPNVFIVGLLDGPLKVLVPPAWSLDIELVFYGLMGLGLSRNRMTVTVWFLVSLGYTVWLNVQEAPFGDRYSAYAAASLPFSMGAMVYMYRHFLLRYLCLPWTWAVALWLLALVGVRLEWLGDPRGVGFYLLLLLSALLLISINKLDPGTLPTWWLRVDQMLGNLAYPIFLCHWQVAAVVRYVVFDSEKPDGGGLWLVSIGFIHLLGFLVYYLVDRNVNRVRDKVRGKARLDLKELAE